MFKSLFDKVYQKETPRQVLYYEICEILKNTYFEQHLRSTASILPNFVNLAIFRMADVSLFITSVSYDI